MGITECGDMRGTRTYMHSFRTTTAVEMCLSFLTSLKINLHQRKSGSNRVVGWVYMDGTVMFFSSGIEIFGQKRDIGCIT